MVPYTIVLKSKRLFQVAAQTGHKVTLVDISQDVLDKSAARIGESIKRVAKKEYKDDQVRSRIVPYTNLLTRGLNGAGSPLTVSGGYH